MAACPGMIEREKTEALDAGEAATGMVRGERRRMKLLLEEGLSVTEVARRLSCSRQTIYNQLGRGDDEEEPRRRPSKLDDYVKHIEIRLEKFDLPATVLLQEIREQGYEGGITILREAVAEIKQYQVQKSVDRFETEPGRQGQVDWGSCGTIWHEDRRRKLSLLVVVLGFSRTIWARFVVSERRPVLTVLLEQAFSELGGVPRELLFDNLKALEAGHRISFVATHDLIARFRKAVRMDRVDRLLTTMLRPALLILDEIGYTPLERPEATFLFEVVAKRYDRSKSIIVTSNKTWGAWGEILPDQVMTAAILDRLLHRSVTVNIQGESYRLREHRKAGLVPSSVTKGGPNNTA